VWTKCRSTAYNHGLNDAVRGAGVTLSSNLTDAESSLSAYFKSFDSDGFTLGLASSIFNNNGDTYVAWNWKANGAGVSNTDGTISSTVSVSTTSGFSIVTYTGNGSANQTAGHGLGATPKLKIIKGRTNVDNWVVTGTLIGPADNRIFLNTTEAVGTAAGFYPADTSTTLGISGSNVSNGHNQNGTTYIAYCFAEVEGFSKFGSYTGNGSADGPFVFTGFRPSWIMIKQTTAADTGDWFMFDSKRLGYNAENYRLIASRDFAEADPGEFDILSNGFKVRFTSVNVNGSGDGYIFVAFAENPVKYSLGR
jgi:hypothetical protein